MKRSIIISAISIVAVSFVLPVTEVAAEYPPIEDVKPSTLIPAISFDRTPASPNPDARKNVVAVAVGQQTTVVAFLNEAVTQVISSVGKNQKFSVQIKAPNGKIIVLPNVRSMNNGNLRLPTLSFSIAGVFKLKVINANGKSRTIIIRSRK
jgi:hypothetical protein